MKKLKLKKQVISSLNEFEKIQIRGGESGYCVEISGLPTCGTCGDSCGGSCANTCAPCANTLGANCTPGGNSAACNTNVISVCACGSKDACGATVQPTYCY